MTRVNCINWLIYSTNLIHQGVAVILTWNSDYKIGLDPKEAKKGGVKVKKEGASALHSLTPQVYVTVYCKQV